MFNGFDQLINHEIKGSMTPSIGILLFFIILSDTGRTNRRPGGNRHAYPLQL